jgi:hypothetical protein
LQIFQARYAWSLVFRPNTLTILSVPVRIEATVVRALELAEQRTVNGSSAEARANN